MDYQSIISKMNQYIQQSADWLVLWLEEELSKLCDHWWNECVIDRLSDSQRNYIIEKGCKKLSELDLSVILRIVDNNWYDIRNSVHLPMSRRECIKETIIEQIRKTAQRILRFVFHSRTK